MKNEIRYYICLGRIRSTDNIISVFLLTAYVIKTIVLLLGIISQIAHSLISFVCIPTSLRSTVCCSGDLLYKISGVSGKMTTETASEDDNFGTEQGQKIITRMLGVDRRNRVLAGLSFFGVLDSVADPESRKAPRIRIRNKEFLAFLKQKIDTKLSEI